MFHRTQGLPRALSADAEAMLQTMAWPGNVRQLRNVIERVLILGDNDRPDRGARTAHGEDSPAPARGGWCWAARWPRCPARGARAVRKEYLLTQINRFGGNISRTASFVGMERSALHRKLKSLGVVTSAKAAGHGASGTTKTRADDGQAHDPRH
jgi:two-component system, NtrC family, nitrogen regulation response regulator NtrX